MFVLLCQQCHKGLQSLKLGGNFKRSLERVSLPSKLQRLTLGNLFNQSLEAWQLFGREGLEGHPVVVADCCCFYGLVRLRLRRVNLAVIQTLGSQFRVLPLINHRHRTSWTSQQELWSMVCFMFGMRIAGRGTLQIEAGIGLLAVCTALMTSLPATNITKVFWHYLRAIEFVCPGPRAAPIRAAPPESWDEFQSEPRACDVSGHLGVPHLGCVI